MDGSEQSAEGSRGTMQRLQLERGRGDEPRSNGHAQPRPAHDDMSLTGTSATGSCTREGCAPRPGPSHCAPNRVLPVTSSSESSLPAPSDSDTARRVDESDLYYAVTRRARVVARRARRKRIRKQPATQARPIWIERNRKLHIYRMRHADHHLASSATIVVIQGVRTSQSLENNITYIPT